MINTIIAKLENKVKLIKSKDKINNLSVLSYIKRYY